MNTQLPLAVRFPDAALREFLTSKYQFRFNEITGVTEFKPIESDAATYRPVGVRELNSLCLDAHDAGINCWDKDLVRFVKSTHVGSYHPFRLYMDTLPEWDGTDYVTPLARRVSVQRLWPKRFHRWMLGVAVQWMGITRLHANSAAPLLVSEKQGMGKSTFCRSLLPPSLSAYYTDSFDMGSKGNAEQKMSCMGIINLDEFDKIPARKMPLLKNLMQMATLNLRKAYEGHFSALPRIASFIGTSNTRRLLTDPTGSRRFLCVEVKQPIDSSDIPHDQLYAQLKHELLAGERYWFSKAEELDIQSDNLAFYRFPTQEMAFRSCFRAARADEPGRKLSLKEIQRVMADRFPALMVQVNDKEFARQLMSWGVKRVHTRLGNCYQVVKLE
ncbi:VapE domain-containing protein [uncultured Bacteroides sp.]|uniref:VapE domain-containing protein n=1 Tax=uncultured Bacteroides sp. TaxID=162156 RepID=UPI00260AA299|nr:VapE domain-containing protein [uncultured Bacteroides sp.]